VVPSWIRPGNGFGLHVRPRCIQEGAAAQCNLPRGGTGNPAGHGKNGEWTYVLDISELNQGDYLSLRFYANNSFGKIIKTNNDGNDFIILVGEYLSPNSNITYHPQDEPNYVSNSTFFFLNAIDIGDRCSGIHNISYRIDGGAWNEYTDSFALTDYTHGTHTIKYYATDNAGNEEPIQQESIFLDIQAPNITCVLSELYLNTTAPQYNHTALQINCSVEDDTSIKWVFLCENSSGTFLNHSMAYLSGNYTFDLHISSLNWSDEVMFSFYANDSAGNIRWKNNGGVNYTLHIHDFYAPNSTINFTIIETPNFISNTTQFFLSATDGIDGASGVQNISYRIDSDSWNEYIGSFTLSDYSEGTHIIEYKAIDRAGNIEHIQNVSVYLDIKNATSSILFSYHQNESIKYISNNTEFIINCNDGIGSGVQDIKYKIDSEPLYSYNENFTLKGYSEGFHNITFYSIDKVGNVEPKKTIKVYLDVTVVELNLFYDLIKNPSYVDENTVFNLTHPKDLGAGVKDIQYKIDDGAWKNQLTFRLNGLNTGEYTIYYRVEDYVGNSIEKSEVVFLVSNNSDLDNDNLIYSREISLGTDPFNDDCDDDKLLDGDEVDLYGTSPLRKDSDGDGYTDYEEIRNYHTDPNSAFSSLSINIILFIIIGSVSITGSAIATKVIIKKYKLRRRNKVEKKTSKALLNPKRTLINYKNLNKKLKKVNSNLHILNLLQKHKIDGKLISKGKLFIKENGIENLLSKFEERFRSISQTNLKDYKNSQLFRIDINKKNLKK